MYLRKIFVGLFLLLSLNAVGYATLVFYDIPENYAGSKAINYIYSKGIVQGYKDSGFHPADLINRAEFVKIVMESEKSDTLDDYVGSDCFPDVKDQWFASYICKAKDLGVISGYPDQKFHPELNIKYAEAAKVIVNVWNLSDRDINVADLNSEVWYRPFVDILTAKGIVPKSIKDNAQQISRREMAILIYGLLSGDLSQLGEPDSGSLKPYIGPVNVKPCESKPNLKFTDSFVDIDEISGIVPPGSANGDMIKPHGYIRVENAGKVAIYAPTDMDLISGVYYAEGDISGQYLLDFRASCEITIRFDHISDPVESIRNALPSVPKNDTGSYPNIGSLMIHFKAGEIIAYSGGTVQANRFDLGVYDTSHVNQFVNQERYKFWDQNLHAVCPYDYFPADLKEKYYSIFETRDGKIMTGASCRSASQDVRGTISGAWFDNDYGRLVFGTEINDKALTVARTGAVPLIIEEGNPTFMLPREVKAEHCFADAYAGRLIYVKLISDMVMDVYIDEGSGVCPSVFPDGGGGVGGGAKRYYR